MQKRDFDVDTLKSLLKSWSFSIIVLFTPHSASILWYLQMHTTKYSLLQHNFFHKFQYIGFHSTSFVIFNLIIFIKSEISVSYYTIIWKFIEIKSYCNIRSLWWIWSVWFWYWHRVARWLEQSRTRFIFNINLK